MYAIQHLSCALAVTAGHQPDCPIEHQIVCLLKEVNLLVSAYAMLVFLALTLTYTQVTTTPRTRAHILIQTHTHTNTHTHTHTHTYIYIYYILYIYNMYAIQHLSCAASLFISKAIRTAAFNSIMT